jgi:hypothetical protein
MTGSLAGGGAAFPASGSVPRPASAAPAARAGSGVGVGGGCVAGVCGAGGCGCGGAPARPVVVDRPGVEVPRPSLDFACGFGDGATPDGGGGGATVGGGGGASVTGGVAGGGAAGFTAAASVACAGGGVAGSVAGALGGGGDTGAASGAVWRDRVRKYPPTAITISNTAAPATIVTVFAGRPVFPAALVFEGCAAVFAAGAGGTVAGGTAIGCEP